MKNLIALLMIFTLPLSALAQNRTITICPQSWENAEERLDGKGQIKEPDYVKLVEKNGTLLVSLCNINKPDTQCKLLLATKNIAKEQLRQIGPVEKAEAIYNFTTSVGSTMGVAGALVFLVDPTEKISATVAAVIGFGLVVYGGVVEIKNIYSEEKAITSALGTVQKFLAQGKENQCNSYPDQNIKKFTKALESLSQKLQEETAQQNRQVRGASNSAAPDIR